MQLRLNQQKTTQKLSEDNLEVSEGELLKALKAESIGNLKERFKKH